MEPNLNYSTNPNHFNKKINNFISLNKKSNDSDFNLTFTHFPINQPKKGPMQFNSTFIQWPKELKNLRLNQNRQTKNKQITKTNKKTLILDLDETLVHSSFLPFKRKSDLSLPIKVNKKNRIVYILRRPYAIEFLKEISSYFEIVIYTASIGEYASRLLDEMDKDKIISNRYYRESCILYKGLYIKDLRFIGKKFKKVS